MAIPIIRINAPYLYLCKANNEYTLYVFIRIYTNTTLTGPTPPPNTAGLSSLLFLVSGSAGAGTQDNYFRIDNITAPIPANPLDKPEITVKVNKLNYTPPANESDPSAMSKRESTLLYEDADLQPPVMDATNIAFNCPYTYLTNPYAIDGEDGRTNRTPDYAGRCHVPLQNHNPAVIQPALVSNSLTGIATQQIDITGNAGSMNLFIPHGNIDCNTKEYKDTQRVAGYFEVRVISSVAGNLPRKSKTRNLSSDTHPNGFID